jgi:hypothetical protein
MEGIISIEQANELRLRLKQMRKLAIRWANVYHNDRHKAVQRIEELEKELEDRKNDG